MYKDRHSTSALCKRSGALATPFASRTSRAIRSTDYPGSTRSSLVTRSLYSPLTDPHLKKYYANKLLNTLSPAPKLQLLGN